ncbi:MAG: hypothetical protein P0S96_02075 [Simkaniaceae bacterium]|nr:hypothetical protein [Candidatus Sacchlamyda saccharinae]
MAASLAIVGIQSFPDSPPQTPRGSPSPPPIRETESRESPWPTEVPDPALKEAFPELFHSPPKPGELLDAGKKGDTWGVLVATENVSNLSTDQKICAYIYRARALNAEGDFAGSNNCAQQALSIIPKENCNENCSLYSRMLEDIITLNNNSHSTKV